MALQVQLVVLVSVFVMVSTVWSVSFLLFYSGFPRVQPFVKLGGGARAPVPYVVGATAGTKLYCLVTEARVCSV